MAESTEHQATGMPGPGPSDPRRWRALAVCLVAGFMTLLDVSIVNVALPSIKEGLDTPESDLQWVLSGYALAFGLVLIPGGRLGDARGRRAVFMAGLVLFTLASAACGAAQSSLWLVVARLLQGAAGGLLSPQISALIQQMFSGRERGRAFGMFGTVVGISTAVGPLLGGLLIQVAGAQEGWRWVFYVNLPIGVVCLLLARRLLPDTPSATRVRPRDLDPVGVLLLGAGVLALLLPFVQAQQWPGDAKWLLLVVAAVLLTAFVAWESRCARRNVQPVLNLSLFRLRSFWLGCLMILLYFAGFTSIFFISTLYLQSGLHYTALEAGLAITPFALGAGASATIGGGWSAASGGPSSSWGSPWWPSDSDSPHWPHTWCRAGAPGSRWRPPCCWPVWAAVSSSHPTRPSPCRRSRSTTRAAREAPSRPASASAPPSGSPPSARSSSPSWGPVTGRRPMTTGSSSPSRSSSRA